MKKSIPQVLILALFLAFGPGNIHAQTDFSGIWQGSWTSVFSDSGRLDTTILQTGSSIGGTLSIFGADCPSQPDFINIPITGSVSGDVVSFSFRQPVVCPDDGSLNTLAVTNGTRTGNAISGSYTVISDGEIFDSGTFQLNKLCCTILVTVGGGGTVSPSGSVPVNPGASITFTITSDPGYGIADVKVDGVSKGAIKSYTFTNVNSNHTLAATFSRVKVKALPFIAPLLED